MAHVAASAMTPRFLLLPQLRAAQSAGYRVSVICGPGSHLSGVRDMGIAVFEVPFVRRAIAADHFLVVVQLVRLFWKERIDILHVHTPVAAALARVAAAMSPVPVVIYTAHGFYFHDNMPRHQRFAWRGLEWLLSKQTDLVFSQSAEDVKTNHGQGIGLFPHIRYLGNGTDPERYKFSAELRGQIREELGIPAQAFAVCFVGRLVQEKGADELLSAVRELLDDAKDVHLILVGETLASDRDPLESQDVLDELTARGRLHATGFQDNPHPYLVAGDAFCLPSWREGLPRSIIEAMFAERPVVATDVRGPREEVVEGVTGYLVPPRDAAALASALHRLVSNPAGAVEMGRKGRIRALSAFNEQDVIQRILRAYATLAHRKLLLREERCTK